MLSLHLWTPFHRAEECHSAVASLDRYLDLHRTDTTPEGKVWSSELFLPPFLARDPFHQNKCPEQLLPDAEERQYESQASRPTTARNTKVYLDIGGRAWIIGAHEQAYFYVPWSQAKLYRTLKRKVTALNCTWKEAGNQWRCLRTGDICFHLSVLDKSSEAAISKSLQELQARVSCPQLFLFFPHPQTFIAMKHQEKLQEGWLTWYNTLEAFLPLQSTSSA